MRVDIISSAEKTVKGTRFQVLAVYFPQGRLPVENRLWLKPTEDELVCGQYRVDIEKVVVPDKENQNRPCVWFRAQDLISTAMETALKPVSAVSAADRKVG